MKNTRKKYAVLAVLMAASMLASGCGKDGGNAEETSISVNVIGGDSADAGESMETAVVTDANGEAVTGFDGNVLTEVVTEPGAAETAPTETLSEEDILAAMTTTEQAEKPSVNVSQNAGVRYAYETLTDREKELYDMIYQGVCDLRYKICAEDAYTLEEWVKVYGLVYNQEPELFYMGSKIKVGKLFYLTKDSETINQMQKDIDAVADKLVTEANGKSSTFEKLKVFHDFLVLNSSFELIEGDDFDYNASIYNAFGSGEPQGNIQCAGYAKAMQYLCDKAGISCMVVTGETAEGQTHAWNVVDVDGVWYNLDATWDDPLLSTPNYAQLRYNYFLVPDKFMHDITHFHVSQKKMSNGDYVTYFEPPACTETAENYFVKSGIVYSDFDAAEAAIKAEIESAAKDGSRTAQIMVASKELYDQIYANRLEYNKFAKTFDGVKGVNDECSEVMLLLEFDVIYN
ncbi:MAG: hypothetical protein J6K17_04750 [Oscillospiraceae bacterium]|nr:hypothetical protein [Oscillospiraceae bacterium]